MNREHEVREATATATTGEDGKAVYPGFDVSHVAVATVELDEEHFLSTAPRGPQDEHGWDVDMSNVYLQIREKIK